MKKMHAILTAALFLGTTAIAQEAAPAATPAAVPADTAKVAEAEPATPTTEAVATDSTAATAATADSTVAAAEPATAPATEPAAEPVAEPATDSAAVITATAEPAAEPATICPVEEPTKQQAPEAEKRWYNIFAVGITTPISKYNTDGKKIDVINYGLEYSYIGMARSGFSLKVSMASGGAATDNIKFVNTKDDWQQGNYFVYDLGLGYTFGVGKDLSLTILANVGYEAVYFEGSKDDFKHDELGKVRRKYSESLTDVILGGDIIGYMGLTKHAGFFASVGGRWIASSTSQASVHYKKGDFTRTETKTDDDSGIYSIVPTIGIMFNF